VIGRRTFIRGSILVSVIARGSAEGQQRRNMPRIGILDYSAIWEPFRHALRELGYVEGQNIAIEYRSKDGRREGLVQAAAELVRLKVDVIAAFGAVAVLAAKQATSSVPIVMIAVGDPVRTGIVTNLARPGGNVTGSTILGAEVSPKRLELLQEVLPDIARVAFLYNPANPANVLHFEDIQGAARVLRIRLLPVEVTRPSDFEVALTAVMKNRPMALVMTADPMHQLHIGRVIEFAAKNRLPTMHQLREHVEAGGRMSYGASLPDLMRRGAVYVDKILKGARPGDLPVEQPTKYELVINLKTLWRSG
jgi:putative tryptophan/tyrosine transport system substrate-binding protein